MKKLLNNLYITTDGSYLHKERETIVIEQEGKKAFQLPFHAVGNLFCFGRVMVSPDVNGSMRRKGDWTFVLYRIWKISRAGARAAKRQCIVAPYAIPVSRPWTRDIVTSFL